MCHIMYFKRAHRVETQQNIELMTIVLTWCVNIIVGCSMIPPFFSRPLPFLILSIILKQKNLYVGSVNYFSYTCTIQIGSNWYMDTGVPDLEVAFFNANILPDLRTCVAKISQTDLQLYIYIYILC